MKIPMQWIRDYTDISSDAAAYARRMVMTGTAVEGFEEIGEGISGIVTGRIVSMERHANSDHLWVCQVDVGGDQPLQIVTGAQNLTGGELVPVCVDGATLPGGQTIHAGMLRGVRSEGMLCGGAELGVDDALYPGASVDGILIFRENHPLGVDVRPLLGLGDTSVDFEILANRPDCQCVWGIARESAAAFDVAYNEPEVTVVETGGDIHAEARVDVLDHKLCPRYAARVVQNIRIGPSPLWLRAYLHGAGMRSINNIVDITNFVMLETGHPMHAFDLSHVKDRHIIVRRANEGETLRTLDGKDHTLTSDMLVIADGEHATGLAGIMGGEESEISANTKEILFECAVFDRTSIRLTSRGLGIRTESSARFEKGVATATVQKALDRACQLVNLLDAGDVVSGMIDLYPNPSRSKTIEASIARIQQWTGVQIPADTIVAILRKLHFDVSRDGDTLRATPPAFRMDVEGFADLAEEALRLYGYESLPSTLPYGKTAVGGRSPMMRQHDSIKRALIAQGAHEMLSFAFISPQSVEKLRLPKDDPRKTPVIIRNPLGEDTSVMRTTLVPKMLETLSINMNRKNDPAMLFECGAIFDGAHREAEQLPLETQMLCIGAYGAGHDFYHLRDVVTELLRAQGIRADIEAGADTYYHPGRCATLTVAGEVVAVLGEVHPETAMAFDIVPRVYISEVNLTRLSKFSKLVGRVKPISRYPVVSRDLALVVDDAQAVGPMLKEIQLAGGDLLECAEVFDIYRGEQAGFGKKSIAFSMRFRAEDRTLTDEEVALQFGRIVEHCKTTFQAIVRE